MSDETLLRVPGYAPPALVVEFNLYDWRRNITHGLVYGSDVISDQYPHETDAKYHTRLEMYCEPLQGYAHCFRLWDASARQWSDHYRKHMADLGSKRKRAG